MNRGGVSTQDRVSITSSLKVETSLATRKLRTLRTGARTQGVSLTSSRQSTSHPSPLTKPYLPGLHLTDQAGPHRGTGLWELPGYLAGGVERIFKETEMVVIVMYVVWRKNFILLEKSHRGGETSGEENEKYRVGHCSVRLEARLN